MRDVMTFIMGSLYGSGFMMLGFMIAKKYIEREINETSKIIQNMTAELIDKMVD